MTANVVPEKHQSIFDRIWLEVDNETHGEVTVEDLNTLVSHLESVLDQQPSLNHTTSSGIFSNDALVKARINQYKNAMGSSSTISKSQALEYLSSVIDESEILGFQDFSGYKINNPSKTSLAFVDLPEHVDNFHNLLHKPSGNMRMLAGSPSIRSQKSEDTDIDDYDETASLMGTSPHKQYHHRSPSLDEADPIGLESAPDNSPQTLIRKSLEDMQKFHSTINGNFDLFSKQILDLEAENVHDLENLSTVKDTNHRVLEQLDSLKSELKEISNQIDTHKQLQCTPPVTPKKLVIQSNSPSPKVNITLTVMNERDRAVFEKLTHKSHSSFIYLGYGKKRVLSDGQPSSSNVGVRLDFKHPMGHRRAASEVPESPRKLPSTPNNRTVEAAAEKDLEAASNKKDSIRSITSIEKEKSTIQKDTIIIPDSVIRLQTITPEQEEYIEDPKISSKIEQKVPEKIITESAPETIENSELTSISTSRIATQEELYSSQSTQTVSSETSNLTLFILIFSLLILILSHLWQ